MKIQSVSVITVFLAGMLLFMPDVSVGRADGFNPLLMNTRAGSSAPDFTLEDVSGKEFTLSSFKGKPLLLNFWATWCPYCRQEREHLNTLHKDYHDKGLIIISVSTDRSIGKLKRYLENEPADFLVLSDRLGEVSSAYGVLGLPSSFLISSEGRIKRSFTGFREWTSSASRELITEFLKE